ncbi:MAG: hypothetical protein LRY52_07755 [Sulfurospirillum cavolei]|nr:hypothetical protein [Sulfurospirillum cavolei]
MNSLDSLFDTIDAFFAGKKKNEIYLIFLMLASVVGFIIYSYLFPVTESMLKQSLRVAQETEKKLKEEKSYLASVSRDGNENFLITKIKSDIEHAKILLEKATYTNTYVDTKLKELSYLLFNDENWAKFLNSITQLAQKYPYVLRLLKTRSTNRVCKKLNKFFH